MVNDAPLLSLPVPTPEQTARFAEHVADNHSWYKHLPFFPPGAAFVFFANPHAGRGVTMDGERFAVYDVERGDYFAHHSRLSTAEYFVQFGHWDYCVYDNPRVLDPRPGPWLYSTEGRHRALLPDDLKRQWSCRLTAFLKPSPTVFTLLLGLLGQEADAFLAASRRSVGRRLLDLLSGQQDDDSIGKRYRAVALALRRGEGASTHGEESLSAFMKSEAQAQRQLLLNTLHRVRAVWTGRQGGSAAAL
jgi:hypothetical protein